MRRIIVGVALVILPGLSSRAQESPPQPPITSPSRTELVNTGKTICLQPLPMVKLQDYKGPFAKTIGILAAPLERKAVGFPNYKPGSILCTLGAKDKFILFLRDSYDPTTFMAAAFNAEQEQAADRDPSFGQGAAGFSKRFATSYTDEATTRFFKDFAFPTLFREDPRYYRLGHGSTKRRMLGAAMHAFVAHQDNGRQMFNFSEWLGTTSAVAMSNLYHPGNKRGFSPAAEGVGFSVLTDMGFDMLREFWPEIAHKFKLPFRQAAPTEGPTAVPPATVPPVK